MPCTTDFIDFLCEAIAPLGEVKARKMMGDYVIYLDGKCIITACDNIAYIKMHPSLSEIMSDAETGHPYPGAKEAYILDIDDKALVSEALTTLWSKLPYPKSRK